MKSMDYDYISQLAENAREGNQEAWSELYRLTYKKEYAFASGYLKDDHIAEDAVQETYFLAFLKFYQLINTRLFIAWLGRINLHVCNRLYEREKRFRDFFTPIEFDMEDDREGPEETAVKKETIRVLLILMDQLDSNEKQAIYLKYYQDFTIKEISGKLETSESTVNRKVRAGLENLRKKMN